MIKDSLKIALLIMSISIFTFGCGSNQSKESSNEDNEQIENEAQNDDVNANNEITEAPIVCLWSKVSVKKTPNAKGKWVATMYLGETATYKGLTETDTTVQKGKDYAKIELIDGTQGWVDLRFFAIDAKPAVIRESSKLYQRPDILTASKKEYDKMQFVVVTEEKGEWAKIKGKRAQDNWFTEGWVKANHITDNSIDVNVAILTNRAMAIADTAKKTEALQEIVNNSDLSGSIFITDINNLISDLSQSQEAVEEQVEESYGY